MAYSQDEKIQWKSGEQMTEILHNGPGRTGWDGRDLYFVCANSFSMRLKDVYNNRDSSAQVKLFCFRRNINSWIEIGSASFKGQDKYINVNGNRSNSLINYTGPEIHYAIALNNKYEENPDNPNYLQNGEIWLYMGTFSTMSSELYESLIHDRKIYGKKGDSISDGMFATSTGRKITPETLNWICENPFTMDWGDVIKARSTHFISSKQYKLVAYDFNSTSN